MSEDRRALVGAIFPSRTEAGEAAEELRRRGKAGHDLVYAVWSEGRHAIATHREERARRATAAGAGLGAVIGMVLAAVVGRLAWSGAVWLIAGVAGAIVGAVLGAFLALNRERPALWREQDWAHLSLEEGQVLLVVPADDDRQRIESIMDGHGGRSVEPAHPG